MKTVVQIKGKLVWKYGRTKRGSYIAVCDAIAQTVQAGKFGELLETIEEALSTTFRELVSSGDFEKFLADRGWSTTSPIPRTGSRKIGSRFVKRATG